MRRQLNIEALKKWVDTHEGGADEAAESIKKELECSLSKASKLSYCKYEKQISASEQKALSKLTKISRDVLFLVAKPI